MDKKDFFKLLDKYLAGEASAAEEDLLYKVYQHFQQNQILSEDELGNLDFLENKQLEEFKTIFQQPAAKPTWKVRYLKVQQYVAAACIIIFLAVGVKYLITRDTRKPALVAKNTPLKNDFRPGGNNAYLLLANGKKVLLNDIKNGLLAQQGESRIHKKADGQIEYSATSNSDSAKTAMVFNQLIIPVGGQYHITLADGTNVWMNSASSLEYPVAFAGKERKVKLTGEAYFEVAKNKNMPFIVEVNNKINVKVLGTHFNIMAYENENKVSTTLLEGLVKIEEALNPSNNAYITPGQCATLLNNSQKIKIKDVDVDEAVAWKEGQFLFNNENIHSIMRKLSRWYDVDIVFSKEMTNKNFDGTISKYKNISEVLKLLELTKGVHFKFQGRRIVVMP